MAVLQDLKVLSDLLLKEFQKELLDQGHNLSGRLSRSIKIRTTAGAGGISLVGSFLRYGSAVDQGVKASRVPFNPGSGKKESKYITGLIKFVKARRLATDDETAKRIAFAIAFKHKKEGIPTKDSFEHSKNGRRKFWMTHVLNENEQVIEDLLQDIFENEIGVNIDNLINNIE